MLTEKQIRALKPEAKEYTVSDGRTARGEGVLLLRVRPNGTKEFYYQRRQGDRKIKQKLGNWPALSLTEARDRSREQKEVLIEPGTFNDLLDTYVAKLKAEGAATAEHVNWSFKHYVLEPFPNLGKRPAALISPADIRDIISQMIAGGITTACNRVRSRLHAAFQHALQEEFNPRNFHANKVKFGLQSNPVASIPVQSDWEAPGERNLSVAELGILWNLLPEQLTLTTSELLKFLIATGGQRPEQLLRSERTLYQRDHMIIRNAKAGVGERSMHVVPLNAIAKDCLVEMDAISEASVYPFQGKKPGQALQAQSLSRAVTALYGRHAKLFNGPFTLRDIRRTCTTLMGAAGLDKSLRDRIQGRAFNDVGSKHYDRYDYFKEKKAGLNVWAKWLQQNIITQKA
ncbi:integrase [Pseudomonas sp. PA15(2017)]|uniref:tyrosine-type recombinase/integrase n=1 Tax=Pseudomonas sp. PA15(2017) TaxID=1932111 RepID=UPI000969B1B8|nr:integrase family protein [Pseudomonas sp. PA15(2017)]OLU22505.1 integrase [Pseudomonas sp. PA15(2017)]